MEGPRAAAEGTSPHAVATMITAVVLVVGLGIGTYFVEVRGAGLMAEMQSVHASELMILAGALLVVAVAAWVAVFGAMRQSSGGGRGYRRLVRRAFDVDWADPDALAEFESVPELRELLGMLMADKTQNRELGGRLEVLRDEMDGIAQGMQRSVEDLSHMRQDSLSEISVQVAALWNGVVDRARRAESELREVRGTAKAASLEKETEFAPAPGAGAKAGSGEITLGVEEWSERDLEPQPEGLRELVQRLDCLEAELQHLRALGAAGIAASTAPEAAEPAPEPELENAAGALSSWGDADRGRPRSDWGDEIADIAAAFQLRRAAPASGPVEMGPTFRPRAAPASEEIPLWGAGSATRAGDPFAGAVQERGGAAGAAAEEDLEMRFPHFVGRPVKPIADRVEVTYEGQDGEDVEDLPASALLFEPESADEPDIEPTAPGPARAEDEREEPVDLRSLGALEFRS